MKTTKRFLAVGVALLIAASLTVSASAWDYTVQAGDSFWKISQKYGVDFVELILNNPSYENPNLIYPKDIISIPGDEGAEYQSDAARAVLSATNSYRLQNGLDTLTLDGELCAVATAKAEDMAERGYFSHTSPTYGTPSEMLRAFGIGYGYMGENIAKGYTSAAAAVDAWMYSSGHRANILGQSFKKLGVGYSADGNYWVQIFTD